MEHQLVFQSDFGLDDGAVSAMYGVAYSIAPNLKISDLTHGIEPYNIWEASYRLIQTVGYWPEGTVFVSVVDPGVGSTRRSIVARTKSGQYIVTPDNGTLTHIKNSIGIDEARVIDEAHNRRPNSEESYTFHGRDVYAFTGAKLAAGIISFKEVGENVPVDSILELPLVPASYENGIIKGTIDVLDIRFGSLWTNIPKQMFDRLGIEPNTRVEVAISNDRRTLYRNTMVYAHSFADVYVGEPLIYMNSLNCMAVAINQGSFAKAYSIGTGNSWHIELQKDSRG